MKVTDDRIDVERRGVESDVQRLVIIRHQKPAGGAMRPGQSGTARIQGSNAVNETISSGMSVTADDDIGTAPGQQLPKLRIACAGLDSYSVISPRRGMDAEHSRSPR
jgi:hypothetical protein